MPGSERVPTACPSRPELSSYQRGELREEALGDMANHLAGCWRCAAVLAELEAADDVVKHLRGPAQVPTEPECAALEARARAIALRSELLTTQTPHATPAAAPHSPLAPVEGRPFGPYDLHERIGRGGMGVVHRAWHRDLKRSVAVKMLLAGL